MSPKTNPKSQQPKLQFTPSVKNRARPFSKTDISPEEKVPKNSKMEGEGFEQLKALIAENTKLLGQNCKDQAKNFADLKKDFTGLGHQFGNLEENLGEKLENVKIEMQEIKAKQETESNERVKLGKEVDDLREQLQILTTRLDSAPPPPQPPDMKELAQHVIPLVVKSKEFKSSHIQNLNAELRKEENSFMLYGYKPDAGTDLVTQIKTKVLTDQLKIDFEVGNFTVEKIGRANPGKQAPLKVSFSSFNLRNQILRFGSNLSKDLKMEKCLPREYRAQNKEYLHLSWQMKKAIKDTIKTRVILVGHILCLQVNKLDHDDTKYEWVMQKEFFPPQPNPTDKTETKKPRPGFTPTAQLTENEQAILFFSTLVPGEDETVPIMTPTGTSSLIDSVDKKGKHKIFVKLPNKELCLDWHNLYQQKPFNVTNHIIELRKTLSLIPITVC
jgi:hypothetical protein